MKTITTSLRLLIGLAAAAAPLHALTPAEAEALVAADDAPVTFLEHLCDDHGGRLTGAPSNETAMRDLEAALRELGYTPERETFPMRGWVRVDDHLSMDAPVSRELRAIALGYVEPSHPIQGLVVDLGKGGEEAFEGNIPTGSIGLFGPSASGRPHQIVARAKEYGMTALLYINRVNGGQLLARGGSYHGEPLNMPIFSITQEEGFWMRRLLARDIPVRAGLQTSSYGVDITPSNLRVRIPGRSEETVLVGAHFDSWDEGQGAIDNGIGIAQLYALARLLRDVELERTVELVWFNGEEQGLWGSRYAAESGRDATNPPAVVLNLDMVGVPIGANAMGHDELIPILDRWNEARGENALENETANKSWLASDHTPYQLAGVRAVTFNAPIPPDSVRYYHDFADTFDKLTPEIIKNSSAIIASLVVELATIDDLPTGRLSQAEVEELFTKAKLKARLQASGMWPFADEEAAAE